MCPGNLRWGITGTGNLTATIPETLEPRNPMDARLVACFILAAIACSTGPKAAAPPAAQAPEGEPIALLDFQAQDYRVPDGMTLVITQTWIGPGTASNPSGGSVMWADPNNVFRTLHNRDHGQGDRYYPSGVPVPAGSQIRGDQPMQIFGYLTEL